MKSSKFYSNAAFIAAVIATLFVEFFLLWGLCSLTGKADAATAPKFDTTQLETWCKGESNGTIRMAGGWHCGDNTIEDETGNLWGWEDDEIKEGAFLLLWINDNGTPEVEDDEIVKIWVEK